MKVFSVVRMSKSTSGCSIALTAAVLLAVGGCKNESPATVDPTKAPWLDPNAQMDGLKSRDFRIRGLSAFHLGNMGAKAAEAIAELEKLAQDDPHPKVRDNAREALEKIRAASGDPSE
jgi:hypothetical protein